MLCCFCRVRGPLVVDDLKLWRFCNLVDSSYCKHGMPNCRHAQPSEWHSYIPGLTNPVFWVRYYQLSSDLQWTSISGPTIVRPKYTPCQPCHDLCVFMWHSPTSTDRPSIVQASDLGLGYPIYELLEYWIMVDCMMDAWFAPLDL